jgi:hypothetical protein
VEAKGASWGSKKASRTIRREDVDLFRRRQFDESLFA